MAGFRQRGKTWQYRIKHKGEEISKGGFRTKAEAKVAADKVEYELNIGIQVNKGDQLFIDYYKQWIKTYKLGVFSIDTDRYYENAARLVEKSFPNKKLKEITKDDYQQFLNEYAANDGDELAKETVRKTHNKVGASLKDAHANGYIAHNPTYNVTIRGADGVKDSEKYLHEGESKELVKELLNGIQLNYVTRYMLILQLATGCRISEIMALQFKDIDFKANRIDINKSWDYKYEHDFKSTKNKETRNISVDKKTMAIIKEFYDYQRSKKVLDSKQRLFERNGKIPSPVAINKALSKACARAGIQRVTSHAMRHTHASLLLLNDVNLAYISKRLGHRDITTTSEVYSHVLREMEAKNEKESADMFYNIYANSHQNT